MEACVCVCVCGTEREREREREGEREREVHKSICEVIQLLELLDKMLSKLTTIYYINLCMKVFIDWLCWSAWASCQFLVVSVT